MWLHIPSIPSLLISGLDGVMFSVLAIEPKVREFKPGRGNVFLRAKTSAEHLPSERK
jgi:hypothetical protein